MEVIQIVFKDRKVRYIGNIGLPARKIEWNFVVKLTDAFGFDNNAECLNFLSSQEGFTTLSRMSGAGEKFEILEIRFQKVSGKIEEFLSMKNKIINNTRN